MARLGRQLGAMVGCAALAIEGEIGVGEARMRPSALAPPTTIAELHYGGNEVRAWNGLQAWNDYNADDQRWHVIVRSGGQISAPRGIPAGDERLQVDVGPGPDGTPALVYVRCAAACRVVVSAPDGSQAQTVPGSSGATAATIWGSRVAWVRRHRTLLTRRLSEGGISRLPGAPRGFGIESLELNGSRIAFIDGVENRAELRMESVRGSRQILVAAMNRGIANQKLQGPSWAHRKLFFYMSRPDRKLAGPYRYDPRSGRYAKAADVGSMTGFAMDDDGRRAFEVLDPHPDISYEPDDVTQLQLSDPLRFAPTRPPITRP